MIKLAEPEWFKKGQLVRITDPNGMGLGSTDNSFLGMICWLGDCKDPTKWRHFTTVDPRALAFHIEPLAIGWQFIEPIYEEQPDVPA